MPSKKVLIFLVGIILSIIIFKFTFDSKINYLALGDDLSMGKTPFSTYGKSFTDYFATYLKNKNKLKSFNKEFVQKDYRTTDIIKDIENDKKILINDNYISINQAILNADLITISTGINELFYKLNYNNIKKNQINTIYEYINEMFSDIEKLIIKIRKIDNCKIYLIGFYNPLKNIDDETIENIFEYIDNRFEGLESYKHIIFIDIYDGFKESKYYLPSDKIYFPSLEGYNYIANQLINEYEK
jgi:lysophospholipase L1-like esterase